MFVKFVFILLCFGRTFSSTNGIKKTGSVRYKDKAYQILCKDCPAFVHRIRPSWQSFSFSFTNSLNFFNVTIAFLKIECKCVNATLFIYFLSEFLYNHEVSFDNVTTHVEILDTSLCEVSMQIKWWMIKWSNLTVLLCFVLCI